MNNKINDIIEESSSVILESKKLRDKIESVVNLIIKCFKKGNKVVIFGNGGSAADAQHFAAELVGRYKIERNSLPAVALTTDTSIITAIGNDYGFEYVFARQCESMVKRDDLVIAITTSGKSKNVINAIETSKKRRAFIVGLTGSNGRNLQQLVDVLLAVPSKSTPRIQEVHRVILHIICELVDEYYKNKKHHS